MKKIEMFIALLLMLIATPKAVGQTGDEQFQKGLQLEEVKGELGKAIDVYKDIISAYAPNKRLVARSLLQMGKCYEKLGKSEARKVYERVVREFADQSELAAEARARLSVLAGATAGDHVKSMTARRIWSGSNHSDFGSPSPDGRYLSLADWDIGGDLALYEISTGEKHRVRRTVDGVQSAGFAYRSVFSPDGNQIAYNWYNDKCEVRVISVDGSSDRILYRNEEVSLVNGGVPNVYIFDWSRDGKYIAAGVSKNDGTCQIALVSPADSSVRIVKSIGSRPITNMCFSPDGRYLAYNCASKDTSRQRDIYVLSIDGSRDVSVVHHPADEVLFGWAPSGKTIVFGSNRTGAMDGWSLKLEEGGAVGDPVLIKKDIGEMSPMGFSQNGSFYYSVNTGMQDIFGVTIDSSGRVLSPPAKITQRFVGSNFCPAWSSDGRYLAYISQRQRVVDRSGWRSSVLCMLAMETGTEREFVLNLDFPFNPRWSADNRSIFIRGSDGKGVTGLFKIDVQTGGVSPFLVRPELWMASFAPAESMLYFNMWGDDYDKGIVKRDLTTGQETHLTASGIPYKPALSPDGNYLAYSSYLSAEDSIARIMVLSTSGGAPHEVLRASNVGSLAWTGNGRFLLFVKSNKGVYEFWRVSIDGKQSESLGLTMKGVDHLNVRPDGRQLAFTGGEATQEIWVMENFLPKESGVKK